MNKELTYSTPEEEGVSSEYIINFLNEMEKREAEIHGIMILKNNKVIFEAYNEPYRKEIPHIVHSFTKCFTNTAAGIAYTKGLIKLEDKVLDYFPEYREEANEYLQELTIRNLLTMRSGQERSIGGNEWRPLKTSWLDAYFKVPFVKEPGSEFMYSSGNSYITSAIVQRITGKTCHQLIEEELAPYIGLEKFSWGESPEGICSGGNGVSITVEGMARLGLLYLNQGKWGEKQLLSADWVNLALGKKDPQPRKAGEKDYNFHWTHTGDIWCADGMFGQTCAIVPEQNMVIAITAADSNYLETELIQKEVLDPMKEERNLSEKMWNVLKNKGLRMSLENKNRSVSNKMVSGNRKIEMEPFENEDKIEKTGLEFLEDKVIFWMKDNRGTHFVEAGLDCWIHGKTSMTGGYLHHQYEMDEMKIAACAYWKSENVLMMEWRYPEMAFFDHVSFEWKEDRVYMKRWVNMNSQALERPVVTAKICES